MAPNTTTLNGDSSDSSACGCDPAQRLLYQYNTTQYQENQVEPYIRLSSTTFDFYCVFLLHHPQCPDRKDNCPNGSTHSNLSDPTNTLMDSPIITLYDKLNIGDVVATSKEKTSIFQCPDLDKEFIDTITCVSTSISLATVYGPACKFVITTTTQVWFT